MGTRIFKSIAGTLLLLALLIKANAQSTEVQQLLLNVEKLSQMKNILSDMKKGYQVISNGYGAVKNIAQGNFSLHEAFIDGLMLVSPEVRKYGRVAEIISMQSRLVKEYKSTFKGFQAASIFSVDELGYLSRVYGSLYTQSIDNLDELAMLLTSSTLRMSDEERLRGIDRIYEDTQEKLIFLRSFNRQATVLFHQRNQATSDLMGVNTLLKGN